MKTNSLQKAKRGGSRPGAGRPKKEPTKTLSYRVPVGKAETLDRQIRQVIAARALLDRLLNHGTPEADMFTAMREAVNKMESGQITTPGKKRYAPGSLKTFRLTVDLLERFDPLLTLARTDLATYHRFIAWMHDRDYSTNYIGSQVKNWKTLGKLIGGTQFGEFRKITEDAFDVYLNESELDKLIRVELTDREAVARDWFVLDCYTGLRISDLTRLNKENLTGDFITIANEKTDDTVVLPLHPRAMEVVKRYGGFPPRVSDQELNRTIKAVCRKAGITDKVLTTITKGGVRVDKYLPKWQLVTNHTARRSFITNLRKTGTPDTIIMKLAGIRSAATLAKYDKLTAEEAGRVQPGGLSGRRR